MVKKDVKRYCSNNLKNDYESEEINSQDSEHEDKKSDNQYSECNGEEETYAYYHEALWKDNQYSECDGKEETCLNLH